MVGTFLVVVLVGSCWRRTQCFMTTIIFFTTTVTLRIISIGVLTSNNFLCYSCYGINLVELTRHHCVTKMWMIVARKLWCQCSVCSLIESLCIVPPLTLFYSIVHSLTLWYTILHDNTLSYTILHYYTLSYTISHYFPLCFSHCWGETSVWIMWKLIDFNAESRKEK